MASPASPKGMVGVRLTDVPLKIRRRYGVHLMNALMKAGEGGDRYQLLLDASRLETAIEEPSDRIYMIPRAAYEKVARRW